MRFEAESGARRHTIEVRESGGGWTVWMDGREQRVNVARVGDRWSMLVSDADVDRGPGQTSTTSARSYEVAIEPGRGGRHLVHINGCVVPVTLGGATRSGPFEARGHRGGSADASVSSPMAGRVVKVLVKAGDRVAAGQGLVVVESMKMENELRSRRAGTVVDVRVHQGQPVEANVPLIVIGPDEER